MNHKTTTFWDKRSITLLILLLSTVTLTACGGGSSTTTPGAVTPPTTTVINGITVPPEPDATINNATLAGVDSNNNGVRDDVERKIAAKVKTQEEYAKILNYTKREQIILTSELPKDRATALNLIKATTCALDNIGVVPNQLNVEDLLGNTVDRVAKLKAFNNIVGGYFGSEVSCD